MRNYLPKIAPAGIESYLSIPGKPTLHKMPWSRGDSQTVIRQFPYVRRSYDIDTTYTRAPTKHRLGSF